jgi:hypothetical protein
MQAEAKSAGVDWKQVRPQVEEMYRKAVDEVNQKTAKSEQIEIDEVGIAKSKSEFKAKDLNDVIGVSGKEEITSSGRPSRKDLKTRVYESEYTVYKYKHIKAKTEADAQKFSMTGEKHSQFLPNVNVSSLERTAMQFALSKGNFSKDGATYYFFYKSDKIVGYDMGKPTRWVRVELTSGDVRHSQPIGMSRLRKYLPKAEE